jgi:hypothetical protein
MMKAFALLTLLVLASCAAPPPSSKPAGTSVEPGFTAFCATHPGMGTCP